MMVHTFSYTDIIMELKILILPQTGVTESESQTSHSGVKRVWKALHGNCSHPLTLS